MECGIRARLFLSACTAPLDLARSAPCRTRSTPRTISSPLPVPVADRDAVMHQLALDGLTDAEIAQRLGLPLSEVRASPAVLSALTDAHDARVERAQASPPSEARRGSQKPDRFGVLHTLRERRPGDPRAQLEWLGRRRPEAWADSRKPAVQVIVQRINGKPPSATLTLT